MSDETVETTITDTKSPITRKLVLNAFAKGAAAMMAGIALGVVLVKVQKTDDNPE